MKTVVFHLQAKTCEKDISKLKEEILSYNIRIEEKELSEVDHCKDGSDLHPRERGGGSYGFPEALPRRRDAGLSAESGV